MAAPTARTRAGPAILGDRRASVRRRRRVAVPAPARGLVAGLAAARSPGRRIARGRGAESFASRLHIVSYVVGGAADHARRRSIISSSPPTNMSPNSALRSHCRAAAQRRRSVLCRACRTLSGRRRFLRRRSVHRQPGDHRRSCPHARSARDVFAVPRPMFWPGCGCRCTVEELVAYWRGQVDAFFDAANGTIVVRARAFTPADALELARGVLASSERLVNELSARARRDALRDSEQEVKLAEQRLTAALAQLRAVSRQGRRDRSAQDGGRHGRRSPGGFATNWFGPTPNCRP